MDFLPALTMGLKIAVNISESQNTSMNLVPSLADGIEGLFICFF